VINGDSLKKYHRKKHVLVALATRDFLDMAKQLFSSAYFNGGWDGDFLLLTYDVPDEDLSWFRERDVIIKHTPPLYEGNPGGMHSCLASKFYMFTPYFKNWDTVIYSDLDAIVKESLDGLKEVKGFWAVEDWSSTYTDQILNDEEIEERGLSRVKYSEVTERVRQRYEIQRRPFFCAGLMAFSTDIITENMFAELKKTMDDCHIISKYGDQLAFNLYFYNKWKKLSHTYNVLVRQDTSEDSYRAEAYTRWGIAENVNAYMLHVFDPKPWDERSSYHGEWLMNLKKADQIGLCKVDKDFNGGIDKIKRTERRIKLMERTYDVIERFFPFKRIALKLLNFMYWRLYVTMRRKI